MEKKQKKDALSGFFLRKIVKIGMKTDFFGVFFGEKKRPHFLVADNPCGTVPENDVNFIPTSGRGRHEDTAGTSHFQDVYGDSVRTDRTGSKQIVRADPQEQAGLVHDERRHIRQCEKPGGLEEHPLP